MEHSGDLLPDPTTARRSYYRVRMTDVLVISGPAGVGKSSVAFEVSHQLQALGSDHALIDTDKLDRIYPVPADLSRLAEQNLGAIWRAFSARSATRLILVGVYLDRPAELDWITRAVPNARLTLVPLLASEAVLLDRLTRREIGSALEAQLARTRLQLRALHDDQRANVHMIATDGHSVLDLAHRIVTLWSASS